MRPVPTNPEELALEREQVDEMLSHAIDVADQLKTSRNPELGMLCTLDAQLRQLVVELRYMNDQDDQARQNERERYEPI
jgi:hypothetical protein